MLNSCIFEGRLVADPELKRTESGLSICNFKIAVDRTVKREGKSALFLPVTFFGATAENLAKFFRKGKAVIVTGRLENDEFTDKETGEKKTIFFLNGSTFEFPLAEKSAERKPAEQPTESDAVDEYSDGRDGLDIVSDDLPF